MSCNISQSIVFGDVGCSEGCEARCLDRPEHDPRGGGEGDDGRPCQVPLLKQRVPEGPKSSEEFKS